MADFDLTQSEYDAAVARGAQTRRRGPLAESVRYDRVHDRIVVRLDTGIEIGFAPADAQGLAGASPAELMNVEIAESGLGLHWPLLDADHWVPALAQGILGSEKWMERRRAARADAAE